MPAKPPRFDPHLVGREHGGIRDGERSRWRGATLDGPVEAASVGEQFQVPQLAQAVLQVALCLKNCSQTLIATTSAISAQPLVAVKRTSAAPDDCGRPSSCKVRRL